MNTHDNSQSATILLVEDDALVNAWLATILERSGYRTVTARNANHAISQAAAVRGPIHLLITDVTMPAGTGTELAAKLSAGGFRAPGTVHLGPSAGIAHSCGSPWRRLSLSAEAHHLPGVADEGPPAPLVFIDDSRSGGAGMRILIADDDLISRRLLESALVRMGHSVVAVANGIDATAALTAVDGPRMAIVDWMMPGADGLAVCRAVRQQVAPYVYVILLTARDSQEDMLTALDAGADEFLTKPFDLMELRGRLHAGERILKLQEGLLLAQDALRHEATHDHLTGLWNRGMILLQLDRELKRSKRDGTPMAVIIADVDHFKLINDTHGHASGDRVLKQVAGRLRLMIRDHEYLARYGGEEFLILLPSCTTEHAARVAERLRTSVSADPLLVGERTVQVRLSLGVASTVESGRDSAALIADADAALYQAKAGGRDRVGFRALAITV